MLSKTFLAVVAAQLALGQTLTEVLTAQNSSLSTLIGLLQGQPDLLSAVAGLSDITILAPSNEAFTTLLSDPAIAAAVQADPGIVPALLSYHVVNGTYYAGDLTSAPGPVFVPTLLTNETFTTVEGGQRVEVRGSSDGVSIFSGGGAESKVTGADFNFTGGTLHIIDKVLTIPSNLTTVLTSTPDLSSLTTAVTTAELVEPLEGIKQLTVFAPLNTAFEAIAETAANLTVEQLTAVLGYHVVSDAVVYSSDIEDGASVATLQGEEIKLTIRDGSVYVNEAKVVMPNVLVKNGVVHVIDGVLIPKNLASGGDSTPSGTPSSSMPAPTASGSGTPTPSVVPAGAAGMGVASVGVALAAGAFAVLLQL
ncbi:beta-Ig-H3/Fasciclin [Rhypophila sp. PSN 637]